MAKDELIHQKQRKFRDEHLHAEPTERLGVWLREGDCRCLAQGIVTDSVRQMAQDALKEFWPVAAPEALTTR